MPRDARYDVLFEPIDIGPVTAKNRFYQVPHCTGMGYLRPLTLAAMRKVKAEGGWGVVCTEYNSIHPTSDDSPGVSAALWNEDDVRAHRLMTDAVHEHGALAGAELWYGGARSPNHYTRELSMDVSCLPNLAGHPCQTRAMDKADIRTLRRWHRNAAIRARDAGFDIVYVYATHGYLLANFLDPRMNTRTDEYGGSLVNRVRLVRELIEETRDAVGDRCAVAVRFKADETIGEDGVPQFGERREMFELLAELPDLWDINIADYSLEMGVSRYTPEAALEPYMSWVKSVTTKPVVTVGRFTSADTMVGQIRRGVTDLIGAARPSIADPFLPKKIEEGRFEDIRECIGCNICYSGDSLGVPLRCTQNPTMGEEWRKGWHPEEVPVGTGDTRVLIVGAGPAGLEAARTLGARGYAVMLAEASRELGGRAAREARLPGMNAYARVRDYREQQFHKMPNVEVFLDSRMSADDVFAVEADHVAIATGAVWRRDRFDGKTYVPVAAASANIFTPDDIMDGTLPTGSVVIFDGDNYYMASVITEKLCAEGLDVTYVTESDSVSAWAGNTSERWRIRSKLVGCGAKIICAHALSAFDGKSATLVCEYSGREQRLPANSIVMVTQRQPTDDLYHAIVSSVAGDLAALPFSLQRVGDCEAPGIVATAVYAGHRFARELGETVNADEPLKHDRPRVDVSAASPDRQAVAAAAMAGPPVMPAVALAASNDAVILPIDDQTGDQSDAQTCEHVGVPAAGQGNRQIDEQANDWANNWAKEQPNEQAGNSVSPIYLSTLQQYYEEEVAGEAYYHTLAGLLPEARHREKMLLLAQLERHTALIVWPLIERYELKPAPQAQLEAQGRKDALSGPQQWDVLMQGIRDTYPRYVADFRALEAMAPPEDRDLLSRMTDHEMATIAFAEKEAVNAPDSTLPLLQYMCAPVASRPMS